ncbi:MAG TPA: NAD-dependent epimerase/dehydratase family protein [bacterium]|nr:NAD-dependent epimerase/dehydratase family protein [bacterium]HPN42135.1 NAD-dependent epimerase/dehydratase family protein [bacterium]
MESLKNSQILITGGLGYLGKFLTGKLLELGANVAIFDLAVPVNKINGVKYYQVNLLNYEKTCEYIQEIKPHKIFHLAASINRTRDYQYIDEILDSNLKGTNNLLRALTCIDFTSFIYASTGEVYGNQPSVPFDEDMALKPISPYSVSKAAAELSIQTFADIYKKPFTILRIFNILGPGLPASFFFSQLVSALKENKPFDMTGGEQKRDFVFSDDTINAMILAASNNKANKQIFNVCSGQSITLREVTEICKHALKSDSKINFGAIPYRDTEIWNMLGSNEKIRKLLFYNNTIDITKGIQSIILNNVY